MGLKRALENLGACDESLAWVGDRDLDIAWRECRRGHWLTWLLGVAAGELAETDLDPSVAAKQYDDADAALDSANQALDSANQAHRDEDTSVRWAATADAIRELFPSPTRAVRHVVEMAIEMATDDDANNAADTRED